MYEQIDIFQYMQDNQICKPCECGNARLAIRYTGCGIPNQFYPIPTHDKYLYCVFCPECYSVATSSSGWCSHKLSIDDAIKDWNERQHKKEDSQFIGGYHGLKYYAEHMKDTIERFPEAKKVY